MRIRALRYIRYGTIPVLGADKEEGNLLWVCIISGLGWVCMDFFAIYSRVQVMFRRIPAFWTFFLPAVVYTRIGVRYRTGTAR
ncbi:hypothetical protein B9Z19DRAFT_1073697 [Tuber borchii]|uniref:Uncharacterized protein n=1 Tax=Tuber borchii TaxID=42251 RepID=A0A2T7A5Q9_TUBBO|nr:hypothetical protein B9Z19DRAFT_1073697 [Tuber borchii]